MKGRRKSKIFVGYQTRSRYRRLAKLKEAINKVKDNVEQKENVNLEIQYGEFPAGEFLFSKVFNSIRECEIAIFDISENNANVLIEVGMALGTSKCVLLLKNKLSSKRYKVPSDISAFIYIPYRDNASICSNRTCNKITSGILTYYEKIKTSGYIYPKLLWGFNESDCVYIVCPELEEPEKRQKPEAEEFLRLGKFGDIDSLVVVYTSLSKLYPQLNIKFCTGEEFDQQQGNPYAENLILLGGPDYNKITRLFMKHTPFRFAKKKGTTVLKNKTNNKFFQAKFVRSGGNETVTDYGFFFKIPNPRNEQKKLIMINGIHTYSVYGAAKCFSVYDETETNILRDNCKKVINEFGNDPNFAVLLEVKSINNIIGIPRIKKGELIAL